MKELICDLCKSTDVEARPMLKLIQENMPLLLEVLAEFAAELEYQLGDGNIQLLEKKLEDVLALRVALTNMNKQ